MSATHVRYTTSLCKHLTKWLKRRSRKLSDDWLDAALVLLSLSLEPARAILDSLYAPTPRGRPPYDPITMLRALLLMILLKIESIPQWAKQLKQRPRLARIAGFSPKETPAAGTFYLFIDRLEDGPYQPPCPHRMKLSRLRKGLHSRNLLSEKHQRQQDALTDATANDSVTRRLASELLQNADKPRPNDLQKRLEDMLFSCAILPSADRGLLGDLSQLTVAGDGSALLSGANPNGKPTCDCRAQGIFRCDHPRLYTDPTANWGYDSYRDCYYFGHTFYQHVVSTEGHDLPLHITVGPASETDMTLSLKSISRLRKAISDHRPEMKIASGVYDAGHDALGIYQYLIDAEITPVIALNPRGAVSPAPTGTAEQVDEQGIPICPAGVKMRRHAHTKKRHRTTYNCPVKRPTRRDGKQVWTTHIDECPHGVLCQAETKMGPVVYVKTDEDPRLYPPIPRSSESFKQLMNLRTGCERSNSQKKETYQLGRRVCRNASHFLVRLYLVSMVEHAKAWLAQEKKQGNDDPLTLVAHLKQKAVNPSAVSRQAA